MAEPVEEDAPQQAPEPQRQPLAAEPPRAHIIQASEQAAPQRIVQQTYAAPQQTTQVIQHTGAPVTTYAAPMQSSQMVTYGAPRPVNLSYVPPPNAGPQVIQQQPQILQQGIVRDPML